MADNIHLKLQRIESMVNYFRQDLMSTLQDAYNRACENNNAEEAAEFARKIRNKMLEQTDKYATADRVFDFDLPDNISMTNIVSVLKSLIDGIKNIGRNAWSTYRQHLRDITEQEGFPFNIDWGQAPDAEEEEAEEVGGE